LKSEIINEEVITNYTNKGSKVRVDLNLNEEKIEITSNKKYDLYSGDELLLSSIKNEVITFIEIAANNQYKINVDGKIYIKTNPIRLINSDEGIMKLININKFGGPIPFNRYRGDIEIRIDPENNDKLYVINELYLEDYLYGLGEEPQGQPEEKVKGIVVMARSYMEYYRNKGGKFPERFVHLKSDGATSQVYLGYDFEFHNPIIVDSVNATWGEFLTYNGDVIRAPYFSRSGGHTFTPGTEGNTWNPKPFPICYKSRRSLELR
jgi:peptidoglycan hydrolase-like amidase